MINHTLNRRKFLKTSAGVTVATGIVPGTLLQGKDKKQKIDKKKILNYSEKMRYRQISDTDMYLSTISLGGLGIDEAVAHHVIDNGVNLVHMSTSYNNGSSIKILGKVLKEKRDKVYVALKANFYKDSAEDINPVLKELNTEYVDFIMFDRHKPSDVNDPKDVELFETWKKQGKVRYMGLTTHKKVKECVAKGIEGGLYSLIMPVLNQPSLEVIAEEIKKAQEKKIGIMAMKTLKGMKKDELKMPYLKKVLANPAVTTVNKGFSTYEMFDEFLKNMQETLSAQEDFDLYRYAQENRNNNCMMCGECERICSEGIEISTLLRCKNYYYEELGDVETAKHVFDNIKISGRDIRFCDECKKCETRCPNSIQIVNELKNVSQLFV
jgi:uncharacterized protein